MDVFETLQQLLLLRPPRKPGVMRGGILSFGRATLPSRSRPALIMNETTARRPLLQRTSSPWRLPSLRHSSRILKNLTAPPPYWPEMKPFLFVFPPSLL